MKLNFCTYYVDQSLRIELLTISRIYRNVIIEFEVLIYAHHPRCKLLHLAEIPVSDIQVSFRFPHFFLHGRPASNWLTCSWGIIRSRCILYASAYQTRPARERRTGRPRQWPTAFVPGRIEQGISTLMLRRTHSRQIHAGASFAEMAARSFTGLERKGGRCCTAPFRYAGQPVSKFPGFHGKQPRRRRGPTPFAALPPIRSALRHIKSSPASAVQGCLSYAREELCFVSAALFLS